MEEIVKVPTGILLMEEDTNFPINQKENCEEVESHRCSRPRTNSCFTFRNVTASITASALVSVAFSLSGKEAEPNGTAAAPLVFPLRRRTCSGTEPLRNEESEDLTASNTPEGALSKSPEVASSNTPEVASSKSPEADCEDDEETEEL